MFHLRTLLFLLLGLLVLGLELYFVPRGWNFAVGVILVGGLFFLPAWLHGGTHGAFLKNQEGAYDLAKIQFFAWFSVTVSGLSAIYIARLREGVVNPFGLNIDIALPILAFTSFLVLLAVSNEFYLVRLFRTSSEEFDVPIDSLVEFQFGLLTLLLLLAQIYQVWKFLVTMAPSLMESYPTVPWSIALIYFFSGSAWIISRIFRS